MNSPILKMNNISKSFSGVKALTSVDFELFPGEIHALMGENGAGKSTLMKVLSGIYPPTEGSIQVKGEPVKIDTPLKAQENGISMIHQEFNLFPNLSAAENIFLDRKEYCTPYGKIKWNEINKEATKLIYSLGSDFDVREKVKNLSVHSQQVIEIAKALSFDVDILIMDEPSAALPENEVKKMFQVMCKLKEQGVGIVYVSHRMQEVFEIADTITVLRNGKKISTLSSDETTQSEIISMMIGRDDSDLYPEKRAEKSKEIILSVRQLELTKNHEVTFDIYKGEILSLFGLVGSGAINVAERIFGVRKGSGDIFLKGEKKEIHRPEHAIKNRIGFVPPNRQTQGLITEMSVKDNIVLPLLREISEYTKINKSKVNEVVENYIKKLMIKTSSENQVVKFLSGGNQQKVVLSKWLALNPELLILVEPTRGVDVGAKAEIYYLIQELANQGLSILVISTDMPEVIGISDRILVMYKGEAVEEYQYGEVDQNKLLDEASNPKSKKEKVL